MALVSKIVAAAEFATKQKARKVEAFTRKDGNGFDVYVTMRRGPQWLGRSDTELEFDWTPDPEVMTRNRRIYDEHN